MWKPSKAKEEENKEDGEENEKDDENEKGRDDENEKEDALNEDSSPSSLSPTLRGKRTSGGGEGEESIEMV